MSVFSDKRVFGIKRQNCGGVSTAGQVCANDVILWVIFLLPINIVIHGAGQCLVAMGLFVGNVVGWIFLSKRMNSYAEISPKKIHNAPGPVTKAEVSYLPERTYFRESMKVSQLIAYFKDFYADFRPERAMQMLNNLQIDPNAPLKTLSKGTKEKVQLIMVMSRDARLYLLDEPIAGVDPAARDYILRTVISNYNEQASIIISTHLITDVENVLDDVVFIRDGRVLLTDTVENIREVKGKSVDQYFREVFAC